MSWKVVNANCEDVIDNYIDVVINDDDMFQEKLDLNI